MASSPLRSVVRHLRRLAGAGEDPPSSDAELVSRYAGRRDEAAFAEIVQRHGPLVWALCRSGLPAADADDAFQATFLVLARRTSRIRKPGSLACWLSGVARRVVRHAKARSARRRAAELPADVPAAESPDDLERQEWRAVLAEELDRLPEKYRLPLILCYYQGLTNEEAAVRLGWRHGTVCGRLSRAREMLRTRLTRRGVALTAGALATGVGAPPAELLAATLRTGAAAGAGLKPSVTQLVEGVMYGLWLSKVKVWAGGALTVAVLGGGTAGWALVPAVAQSDNPANDAVKIVENPAPVRGGGRAQGPPPADLGRIRAPREVDDAVRAGQALSRPTAGDDRYRALLKERHQAAMLEVEARLILFQAGSAGGTIDVFLSAVDRARESERVLSDQPADQVRAHERALTLTRFIENGNQSRFNAGQIAIQDLSQSRYARIDAEIKWMDAKKMLGNSGR
jgi:RNA polymerase sigma factor (sigma-70 family)